MKPHRALSLLPLLTAAAALAGPPSPREWQERCGNKGLGACLDDLASRARQGAEKERDRYKADLERAQKQLAQAQKGAASSPLMGCMTQAAGKLGFDPIKIKADPQAFAQRLGQHLRGLVMDAAREAQQAAKYQITQASLDKPGPAFDPADFERRFWAATERLAKRDAAAQCLLQHAKPQIQRAQAQMAPVVAELDKQLDQTALPLAIDAAAIGIEFAVGKVGGLLGDDEAKHIMRAVIAKALLDPQRIGAIANHLSAFNAAVKAGDRAGAQKASQAARALLTQPWNPKAEWAVELAAPALQAGVRFLLNKVIDKASPYVYDLAVAPVGEIGVPVAQFAAESLCSIGDVFSEPFCSFMTKEIKAGFWATALANRAPVSEGMGMATRIVADLALEQAIKEANKQAKAQLQKHDANALGERIANKLPPHVKEKLKAALLRLMLQLTNEYVREMYQNLERYNGQVATVVAYSGTAAQAAAR